MSQLNDCKFETLRTAGHTGTINDMLLQWAQAGGATSDQLNDALLEYLLLNGAITPTLNDAWDEFLKGQLLAGTRNDMETEFWCGGGAAGSIIDMDRDGLPDTVISGTPGNGNPSVTEDIDSINFDSDGDGVANIVVPK